MAADFHSKHGISPHRQEELYMALVDMRTILQMLPDDKKQGVTADYDSITATVQGFNIGVKVVERVPYSLIRLEDNGAPFKFSLSFHFEKREYPTGTEIFIDASADLNLLMRKMVGGKIEEALNQVVDALCR